MYAYQFIINYETMKIMRPTCKQYIILYPVNTKDSIFLKIISVFFKCPKYPDKLSKYILGIILRRLRFMKNKTKIVFKFHKKSFHVFSSIHMYIVLHVYIIYIMCVCTIYTIYILHTSYNA